MKRLNLFAFIIIVLIGGQSNSYAAALPIEYNGVAYWGESHTQYTFPSDPRIGIPQPTEFSEGVVEDVLGQYRYLGSWLSPSFHVADECLGYYSSGTCWRYTYHWAVTRSIECYAPLLPNHDYTQCVAPPAEKYFLSTDDLDKPLPLDPQACSNEASNNSSPVTTVGNPIDTKDGNKSRIENDYTATGISPLKFTRYYNSNKNNRSTIGTNWSHSYNAKLTENIHPLSVTYVEGDSNFSSLNATAQAACESGWTDIKATYNNTDLATSTAVFSNNTCNIQSSNGFRLGSIAVRSSGGSSLNPPRDRVVIERANGNTIVFTYTDSAWIAPSDTDVSLVQTATGFILTTAQDTVEEYNQTGQLVSTTTRKGIQQNLIYDATTGLLQTVTDSFGNSLSFTYSGSNLSSVILPDTKVLNYSYDGFNNLASVTREDTTTRIYHYEDSRFANALTGITNGNGERHMTFSYDALGRAITSELAGGAEKVTVNFIDDVTSTVTDALGQLRTYRFTTINGEKQLSAIEGAPCTSCGGQSSHYTYDANGYVASSTDFNGNVTTFINNARGLPTSRTEATGTTDERTITTVWHPTYPLPLSITAPGSITEFTRDAQGNVLTRTQTDTTNNKTRVVTYTYNSIGQVLTVDGARTDVTDLTTYTYDGKGNLATVKNALGHTTQISAYDLRDRPLTLVDANGLTTELGYDVRGRVISRAITGDGNSLLTTFTYDGTGNLKTVNLPDAQSLSYDYDAAHRLVGISDQLGNSITYTLDALGNRLNEKVTDPTNTLVRTRSQVFNMLSQLTQSIGAQNQTIEYGYDLNGNRLTTTDAATQTTTSAFDALNRVISVTDPLTGNATYGYDSQGNLVSAKDANGLTTTYAYDGFNNRVSQTSPDTGTTTYTYDEAGNVLTHTDAKAQTTAYAYDALNRLIQTTYADNTVISYSYDQGVNQLGRLIAINTNNSTNGASSIAYSYDIFGRLTNKTQSVNGVSLTTTYGYDLLGRISRMTYPSGSIVAYSYLNGKLSGINLNGQTVLDNINYEAFGSVKGWTWGNGSVHSRGFDLDGQLVSQSLATDTRSLGYDVKGNITAINDTKVNQIFDYDELNRLTAANDATFNQTFSYDANGDRLSVTNATATDTYGYDASNTNRLALVTGSTTKTYQYDANGNITHDGLHGYDYDTRNRLISVDTTLATYQHNALGQRIQKYAAGNITLFSYDEQGQLVAEADSTGFVSKEYIYLGNQPIAVRSINRINQNVDSIIDNADAGVLLLGNWKSSTSVAGFEGLNYSYHAANSMPASSIIFDNGSAGFSTTGTWKASTSVVGFEGANYQHHFANGASPDSVVIDNASGSAVGTWPVSTSVSGYEAANYQHHAAGTGSNTFTWSTGTTTTGDYNVYAKWTAHANRASNATYTVTHTTGTAPVTVNQQAQGGEWVLLGQFNLDSTSQVSLSDNANGYVIADGIMIEPVGALPNTATWSIAPTTAGVHTVYAKWASHVNRASNANYTVHHVDGITNVIQNQQTNGGQWIALGDFNLDANSKVTLTDQADGYVIADAIAITPEGAAPNQAIWQLNVPVQGNYELYAKWTAHANRASDAPFNVSHVNGETPLSMNQQINGSQWNLLGNFNLNSGSTVSLSDIADGYVIADALRIVGTVNATQSSLHYIHTDHLGTPRVITDENNTTLWSWHSDPFGKTVANEYVDGDGVGFEFNLRFAGQYYDDETGLHYNYFRDYDPSTGRYVQSDPIGLAGGLNTYGYVYQNPLFWIDPFGLWGLGLGIPGSYGAQDAFKSQAEAIATPIGDAINSATDGISIGVGGTIGTTTYGVDSNGSGGQWGQTTQLSVGIGVEICFNGNPDSNSENSCENKTDNLPDDYSFGAGKHLGVKIGADGAFCINLGPSIGLPAGAGWNL